MKNYLSGQIVALLFATQKIQTCENGLVIVNEAPPLSMQTAHEKNFAGVDMVLGANHVVHAIAHGQSAAKSIFHYLI